MYSIITIIYFNYLLIIYQQMVLKMSYEKKSIKYCKYQLQVISFIHG